MSKSLRAWLLVLVLLRGYASALPREWRYMLVLQIAEGGLIKLKLPLETLSAAQPALADLRLLDADGNSGAR